MLYNIIYEFEWDDNKDSANLLKHGVRFTEAATTWRDDMALEIRDPDHSQDEERWIRIGFSNQANILVVIYCEKIEAVRIRIISARKATLNEQRQYRERAN